MSRETWRAPRQATVEELRAWPWLPAVLTPRAVFVGPTGEQLVVNDAGRLDSWPPDGRRSIASDPTAVRSAR